MESKAQLSARIGECESPFTVSLVHPPSKEVSALLAGFLISDTTGCPGGPLPEGSCSVAWSTVHLVVGTVHGLPGSRGLDPPCAYLPEAR